MCIQPCGGLQMTGKRKGKNDLMQFTSAHYVFVAGHRVAAWQSFLSLFRQCQADGAYHSFSFNVCASACLWRFEAVLVTNLHLLLQNVIKRHLNSFPTTAMCFVFLHVGTPHTSFCDTLRTQEPLTVNTNMFTVCGDCLLTPVGHKEVRRD